MSWEAARVALDTRLAALLGADWGTKVALPNRTFPKEGQPMPCDFWKVELLPSGVSPEFGGKDHERGIYQVSRYVAAGSGIAQALKDCQAIIDGFKRQNLNGVEVGVPTLAPYIQESNWLHFPISIPFQCL